MTTLLIVESPAKAKTIGKYLGAGFTVRASMGHVRDLPKKELGVDLEHGFAPQYVRLPEKFKTIKELTEQVRRADRLLLATDPDREGEAIAWHLVEAIRPGRTPVERVVFHQITPAAVRAALGQTRPIDRRLVDAQQARRIVDRLVGYQISPLLWRAVRRGLSAGRVQSVALRLVVEREREIAAFEKREYWSITARLESAMASPPDRRPFEAKLFKVKGADVDIPDEATAQRYLKALDGSTYTVAAVTKRQSQRRPAPPFITSTLQQEAGRKLRLPVKRTMAIAQELYEGIDLGGHAEGLITYMRTDSPAVAPEAQARARDYIEEHFGRRYLPARSPTYRTKVMNAQEAHEAIRPTDPARTPDSIKAHLSNDQFRLYRLIFQRFIASQMAPAELDGTTIDVAARTPRTRPDEPAPCIFRATGSVIRFDGFLAIYREGVDDGGDDGLDEKALPSLAVDEPLTLLALTPAQHFTQPPPRFTEATLVKELEGAGVGRPSTYAAIISTLFDREYVAREGHTLLPTELGGVVTDLLIQHFPQILDIGFTAQMEQQFDDVASGERGWQAVLERFYQPFSVALATAAGGLQRVALAAEPAGEDCPDCGLPMVIKTGKFGTFMACSNYPTCKTTRPIVTSTGVRCPRCHQADLAERRSRTGKTFYGCAAWPTCDYVEWIQPLPRACPTCGHHLSAVGRGKTRCLRCDGPPPPPRSRATTTRGATSTGSARPRRAVAERPKQSSASPAKRTRGSPAGATTAGTSSPPARPASRAKRRHTAPE